MPRKRRADFFEEIEKIEQVLTQLLDAERDAFRRMIAAPPGPAKSAALNSYRRAAAAQKKAVDRRQIFLEKNRP
jgi:formiminotetrahydrofolate cyclodeaminase